MIWNSIYWKTVASRLAQVFPIQCRHLSFWSISSIPQWASENTSNVTVLDTNTTMLKTWFLLSNSLYSCFFSLEEWGMSPAFLPESSPIIWKKKKKKSILHSFQKTLQLWLKFLLFHIGYPQFFHLVLYFQRSTTSVFFFQIHTWYRP